MLTTKHHDGIALWDAPGTGDRNTVRRGPRRDLVGEISGAAREVGMRFGVYYSGGLDWHARPTDPLVHGLDEPGAERPDGLINDRFSGAHHDFVTTEYQAGQAPEGEAWENCRGIGSSFGFDQLEGETQYLNGAQVVRHVVDAVSHGAACC